MRTKLLRCTILLGEGPRPPDQSVPLSYFGPESMAPAPRVSIWVPSDCGTDITRPNATLAAVIPGPHQPCSPVRNGSISVANEGIDPIDWPPDGTQQVSLPAIARPPISSPSAKLKKKAPPQENRRSPWRTRSAPSRSRGVAVLSIVVAFCIRLRRKLMGGLSHRRGPPLMILWISRVEEQRERDHRSGKIRDLRTGTFTKTQRKRPGYLRRSSRRRRRSFCPI